MSHTFYFLSTSHTSEFPFAFILPAFHLLSHSDSYSGSKPGFLSYRHLSPLLRERPLKSPTPGGPFSHTRAWAHAHTLRGLHPSLWDLRPRPFHRECAFPWFLHISHRALMSCDIRLFLPPTHTHTHLYTLTHWADVQRQDHTRQQMLIISQNLGEFFCRVYLEPLYHLHRSAVLTSTKQAYGQLGLLQDLYLLPTSSPVKTHSPIHLDSPP